jgi:hypothetical protein
MPVCGMEIRDIAAIEKISIKKTMAKLNTNNKL